MPGFYTPEILVSLMWDAAWALGVLKAPKAIPMCSRVGNHYSASWSQKPSVIFYATHATKWMEQADQLKQVVVKTVLWIIHEILPSYNKKILCVFKGVFFGGLRMKWCLSSNLTNIINALFKRNISMKIFLFCFLNFYPFKILVFKDQEVSSDGWIYKMPK